jgi:hypothetical protein
MRDFYASTFSAALAFGFVAALVISSIAIPVAICNHKNNVLISQQKTCYGKVTQEGGFTESGLILALQACENIDAINDNQDSN